MRRCFAGVILFLALALGAKNDDVDEVPPWHLYEDPNAIARAQPLILGENNGLYFHNASAEHSVHLERQREREPLPAEGRGKYNYHPLFHHHAQYDAGPNRPPASSNLLAFSSAAITVAVYYYPWYHTDFHGRKYIRGELDPPQMPVLGEYNDRSEYVIAKHLEWSRKANVSLLISSWWGPGSGTDVTIRNHILPHPDLQDMKLCLFYETMGRIDVEVGDISNVRPDIEYAAETYFDHPNYYKINGRPVLFVYLTRSLERYELLEDVLSIMRTAAKRKGGHELYIVGDHTHSSPPTGHLDALDWLDGVTNYDIFGGMGRPDGFAKVKTVKEYAKEQAKWKVAANKQGCAYIPGATPGYNDQAVRDGNYTAMSRKLTKRKRDGSLFQKLLREGRKLIDKKAENILAVNSFNEWHEDTQIEPVHGGGATARPYKLTKGRVYRGYGELYLNILRKETAQKKNTLDSRTRDRRLR